MSIARLTGVHVHLVSAASILLLGTVALGMINYVRFRRGFSRPQGDSAGLSEPCSVDFPPAAQSSPVAAVARQQPAMAAWRFVLKPGLVAAPLWAWRGSPGSGRQAANAVGLAVSWPRRSCSTPAPGDGRRGGHRADLACLARTDLRGGPRLFHIIMAAFDRVLGMGREADLRRGRMAPVPRGAIAAACSRSRPCWGWSGASWPTSCGSI